MKSLIKKYGVPFSMALSAVGIAGPAGAQGTDYSAEQKFAFEQSRMQTCFDALLRNPTKVSERNVIENVGGNYTNPPINYLLETFALNVGEDVRCHMVTVRKRNNDMYGPQGRVHGVSFWAEVNYANPAMKKAELGLDYQFVYREEGDPPRPFGMYNGTMTGKRETVKIDINGKISGKLQNDPRIMGLLTADRFILGGSYGIQIKGTPKKFLDEYQPIQMQEQRPVPPVGFSQQYRY